MNIPLNIDWQQILLHLFNFAILAGGLYLILYRPVKEFMKKREEYYQNVDKEAKKHRKEAEDLVHWYHAQLEHVDEELEQKRAKAQKEMDQMREQQIEETRKQAHAILAQAKEAAQHEHDVMIQQTKKELTDMVVTAAEKITLKDQGDPYEQFRSIAEREVPDGQNK